MTKKFSVTIRRVGKRDKDLRVEASEPVYAIQDAVWQTFGKSCEFQSEDGIPGGDDIWVEGAVFEGPYNNRRIVETKVRMFIEPTVDYLIRVDEENNAEEFWQAVGDNGGGTFAEPLNTLLRDGRLTVTAQQRDQILSHLRTLPGWDGGPVHAPHPVIVVEA